MTPWVPVEFVEENLGSLSRPVHRSSGLLRPRASARPPATKGEFRSKAGLTRRRSPSRELRD